MYIPKTFCVSLETTRMPTVGPVDYLCAAFLSFVLRGSRFLFFIWPNLSHHDGDNREPQNSRTKYSSTYNQTLLYGHPLNTDTSLLRTVCFVPGERKPLHFHYKNSTRLTLALPNVAKGKFLPNFQISFLKFWETNSIMWKYRQRAFIWKVTS